MRAGRDQSSTTGRRLGELEILHALKAGGMGEVLLARRRGPGGFEQLCAVKTIRPELASAPLVRTMFLDEARLLARLTHPGIAQILDFGEDDGTVYMAMEYVPGEHFRRFAERRPPASIVCQAVAAACRGLHAAHELRDLGDGHLLGVVHRDISPDNLMLGFDGRVKVLDFGIALVKGRQAPATEFGVLKGKPPYMSPEQLRNQELDRRADVFSIAVVLHELLTGRHLFTGDSIYAIVHAVEHQEIVPPSVLAGPLPRDLDDVVMAGLERDREARLQSAAAMADVLERIAAASGGESLATWAERELLHDREEHRRWMSTIVTGGRAAPAGRPTGILTAPAIEAASTSRDADPHADTGITDGARVEEGDAVRATQLAEISELGPSTAAPAAPIAAPRLEARPLDVEPGTRTMARALAAPSRRRWRAALAVAALALAIAVAILVIGRDDRAAVAIRRDVDAGVPIAAQDAAVVLEAPADAAVVVIDVPRDAGVVTPIAPPVARDAGPRLREAVDAGARIARVVDAGGGPPVDAREAPAARGVLKVGGHVTVRVTVDGEYLCDSPCPGSSLPAGPHTVVLVDPVTGQEVRREVVHIDPARPRTIVYPEQRAP